MLVLTSDVGLEPGLPVDQIEFRLIDAARRHHLEERNIADWLLELDRRRLYQARGFSSTGDYAMELVGIKPRKAQYLVFIASRLEKLPTIRKAFDSGTLTQGGPGPRRGRSFPSRLRKRKRSGSERPRFLRTGTSKKKCAAMMEEARALSPRSRSRCRSKCWKCGTTPTSSPSV